MDLPADPLDKKHAIRAEAHNHRRRLEDRPALSRRIVERLISTPEYARAKTILCYVSFRSEVATHDLLAHAAEQGKRVVVPYCTGGHLELFCLDSMTDDLAPGMLGILEPHGKLRGIAARHIAVEQLDLVVVPGLAFDRNCGRLGYGKGYFDRLLFTARAETRLIAVAFDCQIFDEIPMLPHDVRTDQVVTETASYSRSLPRVQQ